ncbi:hypothetical protein AMK16_10845 [Streptomyces sp. CB00455]|uniref:hypothetical protein n=1 Tax=Streptomyces sp. CB00455 TaxID=1703927 RepID=UPI00093B62EB|nr:hypothetical protein [Streptomyces sp. CB00455]OKK20893.1 hypothetical protein AMK16_10845 [Streptomyces sp. CB00455]
MADERDRWLDAAAADRLLSGGPVDPVGPAAGPRARREALRLRDALDALARVPSAEGESPGEAAAVAAFRAARAAAGTSAASAAASAPAVPSSGLRFRAGEPFVGLGRPAAARVPAPRRVRPVRFALAAALASVAVGGIAAAAGAGLLDRPARDVAGPGPAMSVSADGDPTPGGDAGGPSTLSPQLRPTPLRDGAAPAATAGTAQPPGSLQGPATPGAGTAYGPHASAGPGKDAQGNKNGGKTGGKGGGDSASDSFGGPDAGGRDRDRENQRRAVDLCDDYRAGHLNDDRRQRLSRLARGLARIPFYCEALLDGVVDGGKGMGAPGSAGEGRAGGEVLRPPTLVPSFPGRSAGPADGR